jgi:hypothetical protein
MRRIAIALIFAAACRETVTSAPDQPPRPPVATAIDAAAAGPTPAPAIDATAAPVAGSTSCDRDDDCIVTNFAGCCACPQCQVADPHPVTRAQEKLREASCAVVDCDMGPCNIGGMCPPGEDAAHFVAHCVDHACTMQHR